MSEPEHNDMNDTISRAPETKTHTSPQVASAAGQLAGSGVSDAVQRGENYETATHEQLATESHVLGIHDFKLWYGAAQALYGINMNVPDGKVTALIGPSGCGKSTLLRSVNRMNDLIGSVRIEGEMRLNDDPIYGPAVDVIGLRKRVGMVFQKPNPFPMSIFENVVYSLRIDGVRDRGVLDEAAPRWTRSRPRRSRI